MAALDTLRDVTIDLLARATRGVCDGSLLNADAGRADTSARIDDWSGILSLYAADNESHPVRATA
ncbi:hypothetical protein [Kribbella pratensis]|uniref:Uncharacterized protein n=1 Tax=Kribbella pratensis TaxID=2512112 RepID=A0A4R8CFW7_9ACTN|nr:hypothetical protein [Kribbella pratensis]TDW75219.1 hypothetical protein EV653_0341 [Kribbella pratensis]